MSARELPLSYFKPGGETNITGKADNFVLVALYIGEVRIRKRGRSSSIYKDGFSLWQGETKYWLG
jgi:hypothetical protein